MGGFCLDPGKVEVKMALQVDRSLLSTNKNEWYSRIPQYSADEPNLQQMPDSLDIKVGSK